MQCTDFETRLNQLLDRRLRPERDDGLIAHVQACAPCREALAASEFLLDGVEVLETPELSPGFARRVVSSALAGPEPAQRMRGLRQAHWLALSGVAAAVIVAVAVAPLVGSLGGGKVATNPPERNTNSPSGRPSGSKPALAIGVSPSRSPGKLAKGADYREMLEKIPSQLPEVQRDALQTVEQIRPITSSFGVAVGLIRNTLPRVKDEPPPPKPQAAFPLGDWLERVV